MVTEVGRSRKRMYLVSEDDLKKNRVFYKIPKSEVVNWTKADDVIGLALELGAEPLDYQEKENVLDTVYYTTTSLNSDVVDAVKKSINKM